MSLCESVLCWRLLKVTETSLYEGDLIRSAVQPTCMLSKRLSFIIDHLSAANQRLSDSHWESDTHPDGVHWWMKEVWYIHRSHYCHHHLWSKCKDPWNFIPTDAVEQSQIIWAFLPNAAGRRQRADDAGSSCLKSKGRSQCGATSQSIQLFSLQTNSVKLRHWDSI